MFKFVKPFLISAVMLFITCAHADVPSYIGQHASTPEDIAAITKVTEDFRTGLINKDSKLLSTLMLNSSILFTSPASPEQIKDVDEKYDVTFDGLFIGGVADFLHYVGSEKNPIEEKFYNMKITQDGHVAWVMFDYEFQGDHKTENYGVETWQLIKVANGSWKIISVVWSSHPAPLAGAAASKAN
jgi:hypothetical protein